MTHPLLNHKFIAESPNVRNLSKPSSIILDAITLKLQLLNTQYRRLLLTLIGTERSLEVEGEYSMTQVDQGFDKSTKEPDLPPR